MELENIEKDQCILILDFKENLKLGGGPEETKANWFNKKQISDLGIAVIYKNSQNIKEVSYYNYFSEILTHDSLYAGDCIKNLFGRNEMKIFNKISIWTDGGNHFRSQEFMSAVFDELYFKHEKKVKLSYFAEYHGKSIVDGHFGVLSRWLKDITSLKFVNEIQELIHEFSEKERVRQEEAKNNPAKNPHCSQSKFYFLTYDRKNRSKNGLMR